MKPTTLKIEYDTPQFLQGLFANDRRNLSYPEESLEVKAVARDGWISFSPADIVRHPTVAHIVRAYEKFRE